MFHKDGFLRFGRICVLKEYREKGVGSLLMEEMLKKAEGIDAEGIRLDSQIYAVEFYRRFGFRENGGIFRDAGIDHIEMVRAAFPAESNKTKNRE
ncbi:MAG: GNAT family N-acetyltransferase [Methanosarcinaceae archaeon]|nr:GNAT family N-acetyltransferase [Methanosarcinaceae archaeon]